MNRSGFFNGQGKGAPVCVEFSGKQIGFSIIQHMAEKGIGFWKKEAERRQKKESLFADLGKSLPALMAADKIQRKAARVGFDWPNSAGVVKKIEEELEEIRSAVRKREKRKIREEYGDFLFSAVNFARKLGVEPETSLLEANAKFIRRFRKLETLLERQGYSLYKDKLSLKKMDFFWDQVKKKEKQSNL